MQGKRVAALVVTLALIGGGCGGSKPLAKADFTTQAEAVCGRLQTQAIALIKAAVQRRRTQHLSEAQVTAELAPRVAALRKQEFEALEALEAPDGLQTTFTQWKRMLSVEAKSNRRPSDLSPAEHARLITFTTRRDGLKSKLGIRQQC